MARIALPKRPVASKPSFALERTTGILNDSSLRAGDALMTKDGLRVFAGSSGTMHETSQFVPLDKARHLSKQTRVKLAALDAAAHLETGRVRSSFNVATGRSVAIDEVEQQRPHFDSGRQQVRYVGP